MNTRSVGLTKSKHRQASWSETVVRHNLGWLQLYKALYNTELTLTILAVFFEHNNLSGFQILFVYAVLGGIGVLFEVPTGRLADRYGRKWTLVLGAVIMVTGFVVEAISHGFVELLVANCLVGSGYSCISGSDSAIAYDSIKCSDWTTESKQKEYEWFERAAHTYAIFPGLIGAWCGPWIIKYWDIRWVFWLQAAVYCWLILVALLIREPPLDESKQQKSCPLTKQRLPETILEVCRYILRDNPWLGMSILLYAVVGPAIDALFIIRPLYWKTTGAGIEWLGYMMIAHTLILACGGQWAAYYHRLVGTKNILWLYLVFVVMSFLWLAVFAPSIWMFLAFLLPLFAFGFWSPKMLSVINDLTPSETRATVLSITSWVGRVIFLIVSLTIGKVMDHTSIRGALWLSLLVYGVSGLILVRWVVRRVALDTTF